MTSLRKSVLFAAAVSLLWAGVRTGLALHYGIPGPEYHDEFSYLLGADTFASGHLANPPHALAKFFESPHILVRPVYASKYPPGQALVLALGQRVFGSPFYGVVLEGALMIFATSLAVTAWTSLTWGPVVAVILAFYMLPPMYWVNSYYGGCLAAAGGAFVLWAVALYRSNQTWPSGFAFGVGASILFLTRPFEGAVFTLAVLAAYGVAAWRRDDRNRSVQQFALAAAPPLLACLLWTGVYDRAVTGNPLRLPYMLHDRQYNVSPSFWILPLREQPVYSTARLAAQHGNQGWEADWYRLHQPWWKGISRGVFMSTLWISTLVAGEFGFIVFLFPFPFRDPTFRRMAMVLAVFMVAISLEVWHMQHYAAPALAAVAIMTALWLEKVWTLRFRGLPAGAVIAVAFITFAAGSESIAARTAVAGHQPGANRTALIQRLAKLDRPQLVVVRYPADDWQVDQEWVYNGAAIDDQKVVLAHDFGAIENARLLAYYGGRQAWLVSVDDSGYRIEPYCLPADGVTASR